MSCVQSSFYRKSLLVQQKNLYTNKVCRSSSCSTSKQSLRTVLRIQHLQMMAESCSKSSLVSAIFRSLWRCTRILPSCSYLLLPFLVPPPCVEFVLLGFCGFGGCLIFDGPMSPKELKLSCGLLLPAVAETPTCFTIWCRFFIWSLTQDILRFYGDQVELMLLMIPVTSETSPFWIYNHAHQRTQEVSSLTLLHKGSCQNQRRTASSLFILTLQNHETDGTASIMKQGAMLVAFH